VIDEQHRFGVPATRDAAREGPASRRHGDDGDAIPRTLALTVYGDLDRLDDS